MIANCCRSFGIAMRRAERAIKDISVIKEFLKGQPYGVLSICENNVPYGVPLCYAFSWEDNEKFPTFYFHGATSGRKISTLEKNPLASFSISKPLELVYTKGRPPCSATMNYESVTAEGRCEILTNQEAIKKALDCIVKHFDVPIGKYPQAALKKTSVIKFTTDSLTMKQNKSKSD